MQVTDNQTVTQNILRMFKLKLKKSCTGQITNNIPHMPNFLRLGGKPSWQKNLIFVSQVFCVPGPFSPTII